MAAVMGEKRDLGLDPFLLLASHTFSIRVLKVGALPSVQTVNTLHICPVLLPPHPPSPLIDPSPSAAVALSAKALQVLAPPLQHLLPQLS